MKFWRNHCKEIIFENQSEFDILIKIQNGILKREHLKEGTYKRNVIKEYHTRITLN